MNEHIGIRTGSVVVAVVVLAVLAGGSGVTLAENPPVADATDPGGVELYEHRTVSGAEIHTIVVPPTAVGGMTDGSVLGVVVIPEQDRVCQAVAGKSYEAANAGCMRSESRVDAYLDAAAVERTSGGDYTVA
ncbi:hypothetical protein [Haloplanus halophilus]|uniref:hypothetical protein n=1 Tax=Haloplanus halophilus TaxID=2949993 RepID=UPI00203D2527|nr:hypothetical protein [Haloplanus sp. GDY1]